MSTFYQAYLSMLVDRGSVMMSLTSLGMTIFVILSIVNSVEQSNATQRQARNIPMQTICLVAVIIGVVCRLVLAPVAYWYDEAFSMLVARLPFDAMFQALIGDVHPPAYYILIHPVANIPDIGPLVVRLFSVLCSICSIGVVWSITKRLQISERTRYLIIIVVSLLPTDIYYAGEARMYAMLELLTLLQVKAALDHDWLGLTAFSAISLYTHYYGGIYSAVIYAWSLYRVIKEKGDWKLVVISGGIPVLLFAPWIGYLITQMTSISKGYWIQAVNLGEVFYALFQIIFMTKMPEYVLPLNIIALGIVLAASFAYGIQRKRYELLVMIYVPLLIVVAVSMLWRPILLFRGLLPIVPLLAIIIIDGLAEDYGSWQWSYAVAALFMVALGGIMYHAVDGSLKGPYIVYKSPINEVVHLNDQTLVMSLYHDPQQQQVLLNTGCPPDLGALTPQTRAALGVRMVDSPPAGSVLRAILGPVSSKCEEDLYHSLSSGYTSIMTDETNLFTIEGVWQR